PATPRAPVRMAIRVQCLDAPCSLPESLALDIWSEHRGPRLPLDIVVARDALAKLDAAGIPWQLLVPDIDALAADEAARLRNPAIARPADWFAEYHDYDAITAHLRHLVELAPDRASLHAVGASIEGRPLWVLRVVNPDGYQYTWSGRRFWRKNRRGDHGVDLNRNYAVAWGGRGSSANERADNYHGAYAFSEPESAAMRDLIKREHIALHIDFHAFGQLILYPWGHTSTPTKDRDLYAAIGDRIASAIFATHSTRYELMPSIDL